MADIKIRVGAEHDRRSTDAAMADMASSIKRANAAIEAQGKLSNRRLTEEERIAARVNTALALEAVRKKVRAEREAEAEIRAIRRRQETEERRSASAIARERIANIKRAEREEKASARRAAYESQRERERFASRTSNRATRFLFPRPEGALGMARRVGTDLLRGIGVDTSIGGGVGRAVSLESAGVGLAQQERIATGRTRGGKAWSDLARDVGTGLSTDPEQVVELMRAFTGKTGEFDQAASSVAELASMTLAAGANMGEMGSAAGFVYNQLSGIPNAGQLTIDVMRGIVGQTAVGAVEMEEYAKQMGRVAANAKAFKGDVAGNILTLSALAQLSIAEGGATSGADAARSIAAFAQTTNKSARVNEFKRQGVDLFEPGGQQKKPIMQIIKESLIASKGNLVNFNKMWADTLGQKPTRALLNEFNRAGGGEAGWKAAEARIKPFLETQMSKDIEKKNIADYQASTAAKAQRFQNNLDRVAASLADNVLPALEQLAPVALSGAKAFADLITWISNNLGTAITLAIVGSIARAGLESAFRTAVDRMFGVGSKPGSFLSKNPGFGGAMGAVGLGAAVGVPLATGIYAGGIERFNEQNSGLSGMMKELSTASGSDLKEKLLRAREMARGERGSIWGRMTRNLGMGNSAELFGLEDLIARKEAEYQADPSGAKARAMGAGGGKAQSAADIGAATAAALEGKTLRVEARVTNFPPTPASPGIGGASVDPSGRQAPVGARP